MYQLEPLKSGQVSLIAGTLHGCGCQLVIGHLLSYSKNFRLRARLRLGIGVKTLVKIRIIDLQLLGSRGKPKWKERGGGQTWLVRVTGSEEKELRKVQRSKIKL